jgi:hypothetical protein
VFDPALVASGNGAVNDIELTVHGNPLSAPAAGAVPFETATQQRHTPPLFNSSSPMSSGDGDCTQGYGATDHRHERLGTDDGSSATITGGGGAGASGNEKGTRQGSPRSVPLFMAAVVDDSDNDLGRDDDSARAGFFAPGGGGGSILPRARMDASSETVFEQEVQLPLQLQAARPAVSAPQLAQDDAAEAMSHFRRSTSSQDSEIESEVV